MLVASTERVPLDILSLALEMKMCLETDNPSSLLKHDTVFINSVHTCLAVGSGVSRQASTREGVVSVLAISAVSARVTLAFVQIYI